jgi:hypothetical protein
MNGPGHSSVDRAQSDMTNSSLLPVGVLLVLIVFRIAIVVTWHKTGGDGVQYYSLAEQLRASNTLAFEAGRPSYSRLPGYPLFLAYVVAPGDSVTLERHVRAATIANVLLDLLSALLLWGTAKRLAVPRAWAVGLTFLSLPTIWLMSCFAMTESISTAAAAAELYLAVRLLEEPRFALALIAGIVVGFAQLVRLDAVCAAPMLAYACMRGPASCSGRLRLAVAFASTALIVFAPWPIRNVTRFGRAHFASSTSRTVDGHPFGDGFYDWARTWADSAQGDSFPELYFVYAWQYQIDRPGAIPSKSYDNEEEKRRLIATLQRYNAEGFSPRVNQQFVELARERFSKHPFRSLVTLPLRRVFHLFTGEPDYDMPMEVNWLGIPFLRPLFGLIDLCMILLATVGAAITWRHNRPLFCLMVPPVLLRISIYAFAIPHAATHRFLVESFPFFIILAAVALNRPRSLRRLQMAECVVARESIRQPGCV